MLPRDLARYFLCVSCLLGAHLHAHAIVDGIADHVLVVPYHVLAEHLLVLQHVVLDQVSLVSLMLHNRLGLSFGEADLLVLVKVVEHARAFCISTSFIIWAY